MKKENKKSYSRAFTSALIFLSTVLLGTAGILAATNLDTLKSGANKNMLTATNRDILVEEVKKIGNDLDTKFGSITDAINTINSTITSINTTINSLITKVNAIVSSQWTTAGNNIHYSKGNVGIGTTSPSASYKLHVVGNTYINGYLTTNSPTSDSHVATKKYVDDQIKSVKTTNSFSYGGYTFPRNRYTTPQTKSLGKWNYCAISDFSHHTDNDESVECNLTRDSNNYWSLRVETWGKDKTTCGAICFNIS